MRQPVVVAVPSCSSLLPSARRYVAVQLLSGETLYFDVEAKSKVKDLYAAVVQNMSSLGMKSAELFGLAVCLDNEYLFVDPDNKLGKYAPKAWKASHTSGLDNSGNVLLVLYFRVQFYVDSHLLIRDRVTRRHYYLQLRENVLRHGQPASEESFFLLAALALQSDLGDFNEEHSGVYFNPHLYFPAWILERVGEDYVVQNIPAMHRDHQGLSRGSAELAYIKEASSGEAHHGLHLYRLRHSKKSDNNRSLDRSRSVERPNNSTTTVANTTSSSAAVSSAIMLGNERNTLRRNRESRSTERERDLNNSATVNGGGYAADGSPRAASHESATEGNVWLGICARGIDIYEEGETVTKSLRASFLWPNIGKLGFERKKFEIRAVGCPDTRKFTYYTSSDDKSKHLLYLCRVTHQFSMAMQPRLAELRKLEEEAHRHYRESCFPNDTSVLDWPPEPSSVTLAQLQSQRMSLRSLRCYTSLGQGGKVHNDQRISVISNTSSNTTSGIVSDKVQSVDESEDDFEVEIMINAPPAPSLESLALAHLRDNGSSTDSLPKDVHGSERSKEERENNGMLPRKLAGLARFARVGRKSGTSGTSHQESVDHSRAGSLQSSSSQYSASTIHSRSRSKSQLGTWGRNAASSWLYDADQPKESIDIVDGVNSMEVMSDVRRTAVSELRTANDFNTTLHSKRTDLENGVESSESGNNATQVEEPQYWYSCDDDASETCSTTDNCAGATCAECRLVRVGSQHDCCSSPTQVLRHDTGPSGISLSSTSSLCVSVGHTAQNSTLSDCHSVFHSYVSSMDSNGPNVSSHELEEDDEQEEDDVEETGIPPDPETNEPTESPLTATVSAVRSPSPLSQRQRPSSRKHSDSEPNYVDFYPNSLPDSVSANPSVSAPVDYSVRSGPSNNVATAALETSVETPSSKLDFTVTSAVPNTGTYSRRSTVSHTLDTDSDYVQLPPLEKPLQLDALNPEGLAKSVSMSNILSQVPPSPEKRNKNPKLNVPSSTAAVALTSTATPTGSNSNTLPKSYRNLVSSPSISTATLMSEASARFITSKPPISVLQAHATPANTSSPSFAIMTASPPNASPAMTPSIPTEQYLPPPPYDPRVYLSTTTSAAMTPGSTNEITLTNSDAFFSHQNQPPLPFYGAQQVEPPPPLYPAALHAFNHLQLIEQSLDPDLLHAVSAPVVSTPLQSSGSHTRPRNTLSKSGNTLLKSSASSKSSSQPSNYGQMATAYPAYAEDVGSSYLLKDSSSTTDANLMVPVIGKNNYLDVHASNTLSRRPPHPLPQEVLAAQSANSSHAQASVQSNNLDSHLAAQARVISAPEEDQYLGIPPPPQYPGKPSLATVYTNQVTQSQIEQFKAQLYSDVDYVIYPLKDPALSRQEYMDAKQGAMLAQAQSLANLAELESAAYLPPPPPYRAPKTTNLYRSAPNVFPAAPQSSSPAASHSNLSSPQLTLPVNNKVINGPSVSGVTYNLNPHKTHYASNQSLSSSNYSSSYSTSNYSSNYSAHLPVAYVPYPSMNAKYLSTQSLTSSHSSNPSGYSASTQSLTGSYEPIGEDYLARLRAARKLMHPPFPRVQSEESILSYDTGVGHDSIVSAATTQNSRYTTTPAMKPPPPYRKQSLDTPVPTTFTPHNNTAAPSEQNTKPVSRLSLDINTLREKSKNLDLPLISALCNDPALLNPNRKPMVNGAVSQASTPNASLPRNSAGKPQEAAQLQTPPVANIQSMPLPPTPLEALQGKTQGQPVARQAPPVASKAYVMPKHPPGPMTVQPESAVPRRLAMSSRPKASHHQTRPLSWHSDNVSKAWSAVNVAIDGLSVAVAQPVQTVTDSHPTSQPMSYVAENTVSHPQQAQQQPPPLPPPNPGSIAEAKLKAIHLLANSEDGNKKPLYLASLTKAVKNSYTVSPNRKYPVSGLYAVSELGKSSGLRKVSPSAFSHPHGQDTNAKMSLNVNNAQPQTKGAMTAISNTKAIPNKYSEGRI